MFKPVTIHPDAQRDVEEAYAYYEFKQPGLGGNFITCLDAALERIAAYHQSHRFIFDTFKKVLLGRFPYTAYYEECEGELLVHGVMHSARNPYMMRNIIRSRRTQR